MKKVVVMLLGSTWHLQVDSGLLLLQQPQVPDVDEPQVGCAP
jgi:hypothetical protein